MLAQNAASSEGKFFFFLRDGQEYYIGNAMDFLLYHTMLVCPTFSDTHESMVSGDNKLICPL